MKKIRVIIFLLLCCPLFLCASEKYFDKHIIIAVDQKTVAKSKNGGKYSDAMNKLYDVVKCILQDESLVSMNNEMSRISSGFTFNENTDRVSLFAFGIPINEYSSQFSQLKSVVSYNYRFSTISDALIKTRGSYFSGNGVPLSDFVNEDLHNLFNSDPMLNSIQGIKCISLSHYIYPLILNYVDKSIKAKEYYLFIVTDFTTGGGNNDTECRYRINELLSFNSSKYGDFHARVNEISSMYSTADVIKIVPAGYGERKNITNASVREDFPVILGKKLLLDACLNSSAFVSSDIRLKQKELDTPDYELSPVTITFAHNGDISLEKLKFTLKHNNGDVLYEKVYNDSVELASMYNATIKGYNVPKLKQLTINDLNQGDSLNFEYVFYTKSNVQGHKDVSLLPYVFVAQKDFTITEDVFLIRPQMTTTKAIFMFFIIFLIVLLIGGLLYFLYLKRGKGRTLTLDYTIWPITNERFMEVKNNQVLKYDCWYWDGSRRDHDIRITGKFKVENRAWAKKYKYVVEYCIEDADTNDDFSFRPGEINNDGSHKQADQWYVQEFSGTEGQFSIPANVFISEGRIPAYDKKPNFAVDNILKLKVKVRVRMIDKNEQPIKDILNNNGEYVQSLDKFYTFIVKPKLDNSNLWMAFDPGTTGSCAAFGVSTLPTDNNDIYLAKNEYETTTGEKKHDLIFPSKIRISKDSKRLFNNLPVVAENLIEGPNDDYEFGNRAEMLWSTNGSNCFQSIKKLLGYNSPQKIISRANVISEISGQDLAHLLVKGLYNHTKAFIESDTSVGKEVREMFMSTGTFTPQRAIVAVPNNYTLVKIQEMVDSVKRMGVFKEVHYIYESEAVMMTYLRQNWANFLQDKDQMQNKVYVVFDMGGATINATAFKLKINSEVFRNNESIRSIDVDTISKVGYCVGGDDIDYALIQMIYGAPSIKSAIENPELHQRKYKIKLIELAREIKLSWIETRKGNQEPGNITNTLNDLWARLYTRFGSSSMGSVILPQDFTEDDEAYFNYEAEYHVQMKKFVLDYVKDSILNLFAAIKDKSNVELILSGRSVLYPGIKDEVETALKELQKNLPGATINVWRGYCREDGSLDPDMVKSAVAIGACWFAMYSNRINMCHNLVPTSFGYIAPVNGENKFIPVISRNSRYDENGECRGSVENYDTTFNSVHFVQMLGMDYDRIIDEDEKHKMNTLDKVLPSEIQTWVTKIEILVDDKNNFSYIINEGNNEITKENNPFSRLATSNVKTEIVDENSPAYIYATLNAIVENESEVLAEEAPKKNSNSTKFVKTGKRF